MLEKMHGTSFDFTTWKTGSLIDLGISSRFEDIVNKKELIKKYAIGYCSGEEVICRPKRKTIAVMFLKDNNIFWQHLTEEEFNLIFKSMEGE